MKTLKAVVATAVFLVVPAAALAQSPSRQLVRQYRVLYDHVWRQDGPHVAGCKLVAPHRTCHSPATASTINHSIQVLLRVVHPPAAAPAAPQGYAPPTTALADSATPSPNTSGYQAAAFSPSPPPVTGGGGGYGSVPGVPSSFASCVAMRESTNGAGSSNIYGILPSNGYYSGMSVSQQKSLFSQMYAAQGASPWQPYDGC